jgi:hypothetical protein
MDGQILPNINDMEEITKDNLWLAKTDVCNRAKPRARRFYMPRKTGAWQDGLLPDLLRGWLGPSVPILRRLGSPVGDNGLVWLDRPNDKQV